MPTRFWPWVAPAGALFLLQGVRMAWQMLTWPDESAYLHLGYLAATHQITLFQDEMLGSRMPLPFYALGLSQVLWGRDLLTARLFSLAFGLVALVLVAIIARRLAGNLAGVLGAFFLASNGVLVGYFATATYHALAAAILMFGLAFIVGVQKRWENVVGVAVLSVLFLVRTNLWTVPPAVVVGLALQARSVPYAFTLMATALIIPVTFFAWDIHHLKVLAYVPVIGGLVRPLGFQSTLDLTAFDAQIRGNWWTALVRTIRMYEAWIAAAAVLCYAHVGGGRSGASEPADRHHGAAVGLFVLFVYVTLSQVVVFADRLPQFPAYFPSWAPLAAVLLGVGFGRLLEDPHQAAWRRYLLQGVVMVVLVYPAIFVRHSLLPVPPVHPSAMTQLRLAARHFEHLIPPGSHVFLWGNSLPLYLAGRDPYLQQIYSDELLAAVEDTAAIRRNGLWGMRDIERWLSTDAEYVVLDPRLLETGLATRGQQIRLMRSLLEKHFERIGRVDDYQWLPYDVYRRRM
jgi:hypothetical protein